MTDRFLYAWLEEGGARVILSDPSRRKMPWCDEVRKYRTPFT